MRVLFAIVITLSLTACDDPVDGNGDTPCGSCQDFGAYNVCFEARQGDSCEHALGAVCPEPYTRGQGNCTCGPDLKWTCALPDLGPPNPDT